MQVQRHVERVDAAGMDLVLNTNSRLDQEAWYIGYAIRLQAVEPDLAKVIQPKKVDYGIWIQVLLV